MISFYLFYFYVLFLLYDSVFTSIKLQRMRYKKLYSIWKICTIQNGIREENYMITFDIHFHVLFKFVFIVIIVSNVIVLF